MPQFDAMVTFSSIEHSGLGTYGDSINPWGDLISMARAWCTLKPKGKALVGVPHGPDAIHVSMLISKISSRYNVHESLLDPKYVVCIMNLLHDVSVQ